MHVLERLTGTRVVALPRAIDSAAWPTGALVLRLAADEVFVGADVDPASVNDPHAIVERETGFSGVWLERVAAIDFLQRECDWELPDDSPAFAQGIVAGLPAKVLFERDRVLFVVASPFAADLAERLG